ncbi:MAG: hypothetical protein GY924_03285 [Planctomycetaceae bacterium]|nr:hypothetical protein [Planctomycetaceae bacterium]
MNDQSAISGLPLSGVSRNWHVSDLVSPRSVEKIDQIPFVGLQPIKTVCWDRTDVDSIDINGRSSSMNELGILSQNGADER